MQLLSSKEILERIFTKESRPSLKTWRRRVKEGQVPCIKLGGKLLFDETQVRKALLEQNTGGIDAAR